MSAHLTVRSVGGPTAVLELAGLRLLTDPTFDPPGEHRVGERVLEKTAGPAIGTEEIGRVDCVLLSHHQHPDNLDTEGRAFLGRVALALTTVEGASALGGTARGLAAWEQIGLPTPSGSELRVTAVPARHGPPGAEKAAGPVIGFLLSGHRLPTVYVSGDNASIEIVREIGRRVGRIDVAVLFAGAARTALLDGAYLTLTSHLAAEAARTLDAQVAVPVHFTGWRHFTEGGADLRRAFRAARLEDRLRLLEPGEETAIP